MPDNPSPQPWVARFAAKPDTRFYESADWRPLGEFWKPAGQRARSWARACVAWSRDALFFRARFDGPPGQNRARSLNERTWELGDVCEVFIQAADSTDYLEVHVTPQNQRLQLRWPKDGLARVRAGEVPLEDFTVGEPGWVESHVATENASWQVDLILPAPALGLPQFSGNEKFRAAVCAYRYETGAAEPAVASTALLGAAAFHAPHQWHELVLAPGPTSLGRL